MKTTLRLAALLAGMSGLLSASAAELLVEAESFKDRGGWLLDPQFMDQMGSPYLLAHGLGKSVANAKTQAEFPSPGSYRLWVRTLDWVPSHHPGRFKVVVAGTEIEATFGEQGEGWVWQDGGTVEIKEKTVAIELQDLTGFDGRCDALFFTTDMNSTPPAKPDDSMARWRRKLLGLPETPPSAGEFDLVVVGGGVAGTCAAVAARGWDCVSRWCRSARYWAVTRAAKSGSGLTGWDARVWTRSSPGCARQAVCCREEPAALFRACTPRRGEEGQPHRGGDCQPYLDRPANAICGAAVRGQHGRWLDRILGRRGLPAWSRELPGIQRGSGAE